MMSAPPPLHYLALGDSYTIGESVPAEACWPMQLTEQLRRHGVVIDDPRIVAVTGWTTDELSAGMDRARLALSYDLVTLQIGVNNQYRGRDSQEYGNQFEALLQLALRLAGSPDHVFVLSIPDWGVSPFAANRDRSRIAHEIDAFNAIAQAITRREGPAFLDITTHSRTAGADPAAFTADGLHPAKTTAAHWARELAAQLIPLL